MASGLVTMIVNSEIHTLFYKRDMASLSMSDKVS